MKGGTYDQKVEHEVFKREDGGKSIMSKDIVIAIQFVVIVGLCYVILQWID